MSRFALLIITPLLHPAHTFRFRARPELSPAHNVTCPPLPYNRAKWEHGYLWGIMVDGKDAAEGPHAYDWDHDFFNQTFKALQKFVYQEEQHKANHSRDLTFDLVEKIAGKTYGEVRYDLGHHGDIWTCANLMNCSLVQSFLEDIPAQMWIPTEKDSSGGTCKFVPNEDISRHGTLKDLIANYTQAVHREIGRGASHSTLLKTVARFIRNLGMLHPFFTGNGRVRNIILQREIRRLGIACGTMMYNNGKSIYVDDLPRYIAKIREGIHMFERAESIQKNPWLDEDEVKRHHHRFPFPNGLENCSERETFGSGGNIQ